MIEPAARANLIKIAKAYAKATESTLSAVSRKFYGKNKFLKDFGAGKCSMTFSNFDRLVTAFRNAWPKDAPWPVTAPMLMDGGRAPKRPPSANGGLFGAFQGMSARNESPR